MVLYGYFRSSAAYRVRIALHLKNLPFDNHPVHLLRNGGEQRSTEYKALNPQQLIPALVVENTTLTQSLAILEYLEERYPAPPLLPSSLEGRAYVRSIAQAIACDMHPLGNLRVLQYLTGVLKHSEAEKETWYRHWMHTSLQALETFVANSKHAGLCCYGDTPTFADACLIPQIFNAKRSQCDLNGYPTLTRINDYCTQLPAFIAASPAQQPDAE